MLRLSPTGTEWIEMLPGVRMEVRTVSALDMLHAREAARGIYLANAELEAPDPAVSVTAGEAMVRGCARRVVVAWEGIGDEAGEPLPVSPEAIDAAMAHPALYDRFETLVFAPALCGPTD
ncbi:hypothetical protein ASF53_05255 [Methylobacterium sp. Leaf123]|uniref:hypothetical protein n=1 Tax=Methylobacterium sp. Leaf123 TaxID=1736264 RepID=UPI0006FBCB8A|nr:hypothetical protein [Methylobacterium sp. Leaf123]KQQ23732.1 hypothetical protein ASF53_05255 [Methylobacterium sp. Leaf123]